MKLATLLTGIAMTRLVTVCTDYDVVVAVRQGKGTKFPAEEVQ